MNKRKYIPLYIILAITLALIVAPFASPKELHNININFTFDTEYTIAKRAIETDTNFIKMPPCMQLHFALIYYSNKYDIPKEYAFTIAQLETGYRGPFDWDYDHRQVSYAGALGAMQLMPRTARWMYDNENRGLLTKKRIKNDIKLNVEISMKFLRHSYDRFGDWKKTFAYYHTGYTKVNWYAEKVWNKEYKFIN